MTLRAENNILDIKILSKQNSEISYKYMRFCALIYVTILAASTIMAYRIVNIYSFALPGSTLIYTFSFFWAAVFAEVYGSNISKKLIWETLICELFFAILIYTVNLLPAPTYWNNSAAYNQVVGNIMRFTGAGMVGYLSGAFLNTYLVTKWKYKMHGKFFWFRSLLAASISEIVATFAAGILTYFSLMPFNKILIVMGNAVIFKLIYGVIAVWPASFVAYLLKKIEVEFIDKPTFNPINFGEIKNSF